MTRSNSALLLVVLLGSLALVSCGGVANPEGWASPVITDDTYYLFQRKDELTAISREDQAVKWTFPNDNLADQEDIDLEAVYGTPILDDGSLYFASYNEELFALNADDGSLRWKKNLEGAAVGAPLLMDDALIIGTTEGRLFAYGLDGQPRSPWPSEGLELDDGVWATPVPLPENSFAVATMGGDVMRYSLESAEPLWSEPFHTSGAIASLAVTPDGDILVPSLDRHAYRIGDDGKQIGGSFKAKEWLWGQPAFEDGMAYMVDLNGNAYRVNLETMAADWSFETGNRTKAAPVIVGETLLIADRDPIVHFIRKSDGTQLHSIPVPDVKTIRADPVQENGLAFFITVDGHFLEVDERQRLFREIQVGRHRP